MKAKVYVTLKPSVLDPQGKAIKHSVELLGYEGIADIRQGKYFEVALDGSLSEAKAREQAEALADAHAETQQHRSADQDQPRLTQAVT